MRLRIRNFAKVKEADIILDGITVIAGKNNTGKSTVGKVLDSMYNSTSHLDSKMRKARMSRLRSSFYRVTAQAGHSSPAISAETAEMILETDSRENEIRLLERLFSYMFAEQFARERDKWEGNKREGNKWEGNKREGDEREDNKWEGEGLKGELYRIVEEIKSIPDEVLTKAILSNYFNETFNGSINNLEHADTNAEVEVVTKAGKNTISFLHDSCVDFQFDFMPTSSSFYLDNPMLIDKLNSMDVMRASRQPFSEQEYHLLTKLIGEKIPAEDRAINEIINREKLEEVIGLLDRVIPGEIAYDQKYEYKTDHGKSRVDIRSLSTGLKSFAILKQLIMNGSLNDKDAIVLDEPEIHLHPEWQMVYAELIVILQKKFDLNFIINTHSAHFLETLDFYAAKYERKEICHYYLSEETEGMCSFQEVTNTPEKIYKQLVDPSLLLAREKEMWEDEHEPI